MAPTLKQEFPEVVNVTRVRRTERANMRLGENRLLLPGVLFVDTTSGHNDDSPICFFYQLSDQIQAFNRRLLEARSENSIKTSFNAIFQGLKRVSCHVERPMTRSFKWPGKFY